MPSKRSPKRAASESAPEPKIEQVLERIREARSFDFRNYKRGTLKRRIERRMSDRRLNSLDEYLALLDSDPTEYDQLLSALLIKVTGFFRDPDIWEALTSKAVPQLLASKRAGEDFRVWSAGCATGEEAFTAAIALAEAMGPAFLQQDVKVFGTDVDEKAVAVARRGLYTAEQVQAVPRRLLEQYFVAEQGGWSVRKEIRRAVVFGANNLVSDAPISRLDLLLCRNVFIYLDVTLQRRVLTRFHYALRKNGVLVLGKSELIPFAGSIFEAVDLPRRIYRKDGKRDGNAHQERLAGLLEQHSLDGPEREQGEVGQVEQFHRDLLHSMRVPVIATSGEGSVTFWNAAAAALWGRSESEVLGKKLVALNLMGLSGELLIEKTAQVREGRVEREQGQGTVHRPGAPEAIIEVEIFRLREPGTEPGGVLYVAHDVTAFREMEQDLRHANEERQSGLQELQTINEELQSSNEELETTNEELQSANEELQTINEELQSSNEELETTNEELHSTNAELDATNRELAHRTEEMNRLGFSQRTIIRSLSAGVAVLDPQGRVTVWNLAAERLLGLAEGEALGQVLWTLHVPALSRAVLGRLRKALARNVGLREDSVEYPLQNGSTGRATVAGVPILDGDTSLGAIVLFEDHTRAAGLEAAVQRLTKESRGPRKR